MGVDKRFSLARRGDSFDTTGGEPQPLVIIAALMRMRQKFDLCRPDKRNQRLVLIILELLHLHDKRFLEDSAPLVDQHQYLAGSGIALGQIIAFLHNLPAGHRRCRMCQEKDQDKDQKKFISHWYPPLSVDELMPPN